MRRSVATIIGTLAGTAMLVGAKFGTHAATDAGASDMGAAVPAGQAMAAPAGGAGGNGGGTGSAAGGSATGAKASPTKKPSGTTTTGGGLKDGTYTGGAATERYGTIVVSITVSGGKITKADGNCASCGGTSQYISGNAFPTLQQEALKAQSAKIATVSGATYTSGAYRRSLQSAINAAKA